MSLELLEKMVNETSNEEMIGAVNAVKNSFKENVDRVTFMEKEMKQATEKRDSIKNLVKSKLGLDELSEDALTAYVSKVSSGKSNDNAKELESLTKIIESLKSDNDKLNTEYQGVTTKYKLEKELASLGAISDTENERAYSIILKDIQDGMSFDDSGNTIFKGKDGTTIRKSDGSPLTLADRYNQLKESDDMSFLFKKKRSKAGGGATGGTTDVGSVKQSRSKMSASEKGAYIRDHGEEAYFKLQK